MRILISLTFEGSLSLPIHYYYSLQGFVYNLISDENLKSFLHQKGFNFDKRTFKGFCFSNLRGKYRIRNKKIYFSSPVELLLSTSLDDLIISITQTFMHFPELKINNQNVKIEYVKILDTPDFDKFPIINAITPITVYSTLEKNGKKFTRYYSKYDPEFNELVFQNLCKKAKSLYNLNISKENFEITPLGKYNPKDEKIVKYKDIIIKGWIGKFELKTSVSVKRIAYELGLGSKNSQGFGFIEFINNKFEE